jgi:hypothetical protein
MIDHYFENVYLHNYNWNRNTKKKREQECFDRLYLFFGTCEGEIICMKENVWICMFVFFA